MKKYLCILFLLLFPFTLSAQWVSLPSGTTNILTNVQFIDANTGYIVGISGTVRKTTNGGTNWSAISVVPENLYNVFFVNSSTGYICGDGGYITKTTNGGSSWSTQSPPVELYRGLFFNNDQTGYACGSTGTIAKTTNGGSQWTALNSGVTVFLQNIKFADQSTGYAVGFNGTILKTTNSGDNWVQQTSGTTELLFGLAVISGDVVYVSGEGGKFFKTTNGGSSWVELTTGIVNRGVNLNFVNANTGTAACLNNIILKTTNGGSTWLQQNSGLTGQDFFGVYFTSPLTGFVVGSDGNILFTTTGGFPVPSAPNLLTPTNGANNISLTPLLDWDSITTAKTYQVQIDTDTLYNSPVYDQSDIIVTQSSVPSGLLTNNVLYFWRVRATNAGSTGAWSQNFRFRTIVALPVAPLLQTPTNNAVNIPLNPTFDWDSTSPADYYTLQAALDTSFTNLQVNITGITQSFLPLAAPLNPNFKYFWRVSATNAAGTGPWSEKYNFITILGSPAAPVLLYPADGAIGINLTPTLDWIDDYSVTSYQVQLSQDSTFASTILDQSGFTSSQFTVPGGLLVNVQRYFWRVRTTNSIGTGPWSQPWDFLTLLSAPAVPTLVSPPNNSTDITTTPTLDWDSIPFAETYRVQLSIDPGFGSFIINIAGLTSSQYNVTGGALNNNTTYYWRVSASNQAGTSAFSTVWNFKTVVSPPVAAPSLLSPPNGAINQPITPALDWNDVFGTEGYKIIVAVDSFFNTLVMDTTITPSGLTVPVGKLNGSTTYFWRVRGFNVGGFGPWSVTWKFTTNPVGITQLGSEIPKSYKLYNNYPNPFNPTTKIKFDIPKSSYVSVAIYDLTGREVSMLVNEELSAGSYEALWNASGFSSGVYVYRIITPAFTSVKKMVVVK